MTDSGIGNIGGNDDRKLRIRLESQFNPVDITPSSSSNHGNTQPRQIGKNLAETQPTGGMSLITQLNSTLEELDIHQTGEFVTDTTGGFKFKVNQKYLEEQGFLVVQNDLLELNKRIQEDPRLSEHVLNYKVEIDPTRNVVKFKSNAEFKYAPEIVNIRNIRRESSGRNIFEDYPANTLIPVLVGPPPIDYLRKPNGEQTNMFSGIESSAFEALARATTQEDRHKIDFNIAHALNIAMLPNAKWIITDDNKAITRMGFPAAGFKALLSPELAILASDIGDLKDVEVNDTPFYVTPFTPPSIREILLQLPIEIHQHQVGNRFTVANNTTGLAPQDLEGHIDAASFHHLLQYLNQQSLLKKAGLITSEMPPENKGLLYRTDGSIIGPVPPKNNQTIK